MGLQLTQKVEIVVHRLQLTYYKRPPICRASFEHTCFRIDSNKNLSDFEVATINSLSNY